MIRSIGLAAVLLLAAGVESASAQSVSGRVEDESTGRPIAGAAVRLLDAAGVEHAAATSDRAGEWSLRAPRTGSYRLQVERVGYARIDTEAFTVGATPLTLNLATRPQVVMLEGISQQTLDYMGLLDRSTTRKSARTYLPDELAERVRRIRPRNAGRLIWGTIANATLGKWDWPYLPAPYLAGPTRRRGPRPECAAIVVVDGVPHFPRWGGPRIDEIVALADVRAVEIYQDGDFIPSELLARTRARINSEVYQEVGEEAPPSMADWGRARCGAVFYWTARGLGIP